MKKINNSIEKSVRGMDVCVSAKQNNSRFVSNGSNEDIVERIRLGDMLKDTELVSNRGRIQTLEVWHQSQKIVTSFYTAEHNKLNE